MSRSTRIYRLAIAAITCLAPLTLYAQETTDPSADPAPATRPVPPANKQQFRIGQNVQAKHTAFWRDAVIVNFREGWYLVNYPQWRDKEWVEPWRIREQGSSEDNIGTVYPNNRKAEQGPPPQKPGDPPEKNSFGRSGEAPSSSNSNNSSSSSAANRSTRRDDPPPANMTGYRALHITPLETGFKTFFFAKLDNVPQKLDALDVPPTILENPKPVVLPGGMMPNSNTQLKISADGRRAFICTQARLGLRTNTVLCVMDLEAGRVLLNTTIASGGELVAVSPSGTHFALVLTDVDSTDRHPFLDVWDVVEADGKTSIKRNFVGRPYQDAADPKSGDRDIDNVAFVDDDHILTHSPKNILGFWTLAEENSVYSLDSVETGPGFALSPGGRYLAINKGPGLVLLDTPTGQPIFQSREITGRGRMAFSPDGRFLVEISDITVRAIDLTTGTVACNFRFNKDPIDARDPVNRRDPFNRKGPFDRVAFVSDHHLLVDNNLRLLDLAAGIMLWQYERPRFPNAAWATDAAGRTYAFAIGRDSRPALIPARLPDEAPQKALESADISKYMIFGPGKTVALDLDARDQTDKVRQGLTRSLEDCGLKVVNGKADLVLKVRTSTGPATEIKYEITRWGMGPMSREVQSVSVAPYLVKMTLEADGKELLSNQSDSTPHFLNGMKKDETAQQAVARVNVPQYDYLMNYKFPRTILAPDAPAVLGKSNYPLPPITAPTADKPADAPAD